MKSSVQHKVRALRPNSLLKNTAHLQLKLPLTPHVAKNDSNRSSAIDQRTARHTSYEVSQRKRKRVEQSFGWMKMVGMLRKVKLRGIDKVGWLFTFTGPPTTSADYET
jgi:hypothetical protein